MVTCSCGFYWFKDRKKAMLEIKRILKPDGRFILLEEEFNKGDLKPRFSKYEGDYLKELADLEEYVGVAHMKDLSVEAGLKLIKELSIPVDEFHSTVGVEFENSENHARWDNRLQSEPS